MHRLARLQQQHCRPDVEPAVVGADELKDMNGDDGDEAMTAVGGPDDDDEAAMLAAALAMSCAGSVAVDEATESEVGQTPSASKLDAKAGGESETDMAGREESGDADDMELAAALALSMTSSPMTAAAPPRIPAQPQLRTAASRPLQPWALEVRAFIQAACLVSCQW